jgi:hypothetical protein
VKKAATWIYAASVPLCLSAPFVGDEGLRSSLLTYVATPLCGVALVLALATWLLGGETHLDMAVAVVWAVAAASLCLPLSAEPYRLEVLFVALKVQAALVGAGALALSISAVRAARRKGPLAFRAVHVAGLVLLALLLARRSLGTYGSLFMSQSQGLDAIAAEIRLFWHVMAGCAAAIAFGTIGLYASRGRASREARAAG